MKTKQIRPHRRYGGKQALLVLSAVCIHSTSFAATPPRHESARPAGREQASRADVPRLLAPVERMVALEQAEVLTGLRARTSGLGIQHFRRAEGEYDVVLSRIDRITKEHAGQATLIDSLGTIGNAARGQAIEAAVDAGNVYLARADYQDALKEGDRALSMDPQDGSAQAFVLRATSLPSYGLMGSFPLRFSAHARMPRGISMVPRASSG